MEPHVRRREWRWDENWREQEAVGRRASIEEISLMARRLAVTAVDQPSTHRTEPCSATGGRSAVSWSSPNGSPSATVAPRVLQRGKAALELLLEARRFAHDLDRSVWDFALEIDRLRDAGLAHNDLRWLVCKGYVEQASEILCGSEPERRFQQGGALTFTDASCFILTESGCEFVQQVVQLPSIPAPTTPEDDAPTAAGGSNGSADSNGRAASPITAWADSDLRPSWDRDRQELRLGDYLVKQFKVPAPNQEMVIAVFDEEGWPARIDDPLPPRSDLDPKRRLHDTINSLNRNQKNSLIRFLGDGSGQGVRWELAEAAAPVLRVDQAARDGIF